MLPSALNDMEREGFAARAASRLELHSGGAAMLTALMIAAPKCVTDFTLDQCLAPNAHRSDARAAVARRTAAYVTWIRAALDDVGIAPAGLARVWGRGYRLEAEAAQAVHDFVVNRTDPSTPA